MLAAGLDEIISFSLCGEEDYKILNLPAESELLNWVRIKNPLNEAYAVLRTSLVPNLLEVLSNNARKQIEAIRIFELGNVFLIVKDQSLMQNIPAWQGPAWAMQEIPGNWVPLISFT